MAVCYMTFYMRVSVFVCVYVCMCVCGSGFGPLSFVIVTLLKVFVLLDGRDTEDAKMEST